MKIHMPSLRRFAPRLALSLCAIFLACHAPAAEPAQAQRPIRLAVFDIELDDFSAGGPIAGESAEETARLRRMTALARERLAQSGLFEIVDGNASKNEMARSRWLRKCNGCEADLARELGADMSFIAFYRKISVMEQYLELRIRDARTGEMMNFSHADLRGETDESWSRAIVWLISHRLIEPEQARRQRESAR
jgi:hypothetical protein